MSAIRSLSGVNRTSRGQANSVENDPFRTLHEAIGRTPLCPMDSMVPQPNRFG
jgi:hypothetical protein